MKTVSFDEARADFERVFKLAANGETVVVERHAQRVELRPGSPATEPEIAPPGYFQTDYSPEEIADQNTLASRAASVPLP